jgi:hypothetical protein
VATWRDELSEVIKSRTERDAEEHARLRARVEEALKTAELALSLARDGLRYACEQFRGKQQAAELEESPNGIKLSLGSTSIGIELLRETAVIRIQFGEGKPRDFDFAKDRHLAPADLEEYVGRRLVEFARAAQKAAPW